MAKAAKLLAEMPETSCQATICGETDPGEIKKMLSDFGFSRIGITNVTPAATSEKGEPSWSSSAMIKMIQEEAEALTRNTARREARQIRISTNYLLNGVEKFLTRQVRQHHCGAGKEMVAVSAGGDIYLCHRFTELPDYRLGSIHGGRREGRHYQSKPVGTVDKCTDCVSRYHCPGGCYHDNLNTTGSDVVRNPGRVSSATDIGVPAVWRIGSVV